MPENPAVCMRPQEILKTLRDLYPDARCGLEFRTPFELLVATVLSAQCTDVRVNMVAPELFRRWPGPAELAAAELPDIENVIRSTGFFRNKAAHLKAMSEQVSTVFSGEVPSGMAELTSLPGVGRKTANVLKNEFFDAEGIAVDTHVTRLAGRLGLSKKGDAVSIERDLMSLYSREEWRDISHLLITHGRRVCSARRPDCAACGLARLCPSSGLLPGMGAGVTRK